MSRKKEEKLHIDPVQKRDNYICQYCGRDGLASLDNWHACTLDHFVPKRSGGTDMETNLVTACHYCNSLKKGKVFESLEEAREWIAKRRGELWIEFKKVRKAVRGF
jgi:5-methylcytosine-specific restriction endonuclease McrA